MQPNKQYYYQQSRTEMLAFIPPSATCTLEVGCGAGSFSVLIKDKLGGVSNIFRDRHANYCCLLGKAS